MNPNFKSLVTSYFINSVIYSRNNWQLYEACSVRETTTRRNYSLAQKLWMLYIQGREWPSLREIKKLCLQYTLKDREHLNTSEIEKMSRMCKSVLVKRAGTTWENWIVQVHCACSAATSATLWTIAHQAPLFMEFSRWKYCSGLPFPSPRDFPYPGMKSFFFFNFRSLDVFCCFCIGRQILYHCTTWIAWIAQVKYLNSP